MLGNSLIIMTQFSFDGIAWLPFGNWNLGEATHFVHQDLKIEDLTEKNTEIGEGTPLNREYSIHFGWLFFFVEICLNLEAK